MNAPSHRAGMVATVIAVVVSIVLFVLVLFLIDAQPRTHVAYLYADTTALAPSPFTHVTTRPFMRVTCWSRSIRNRTNCGCASHARRSLPSKHR
jgi:hypothetical protein